MIFQDIQSMDEEKSWQSTFQYLHIKSREKAGSQKTGKSTANRAYNRYRDVVPYDHSLVQLRNSDTDYINANLVKVSSIDKKYILTQGPLPNTCEHFWEMVWEQNAYSIVMLNRVIEKNQLKCHQYWPLSGCLTMKNIKVTLLEEDDYQEFVVRILKLENLQENKTKTVRHFHYVAWPDFGVPVSPEAFLKYLFSVREYQASIDGVGPPVIHCSAGIGRSGTFALIDAALTEIKQKNDMMDYDVKKILLEMRSYRAGLIQTTEQLRFSYIAILEGANMVAPEAYGAAYWKMANPAGSGDEESEEEEEYEEPKLAEKRVASSENDETEEPRAKEPRKDVLPTDISESESDEEDEIVNLSDIENENDDESGEENEEDAEKTSAEKGPEFEREDFREDSQRPTTVTSEQERKEETLPETDTDRGGTNGLGREPESAPDETKECLVCDREVKTTPSPTKDSLTNAEEENSRHEQFKGEEPVKQVVVESKKTIDVQENTGNKESGAQDKESGAQDKESSAQDKESSAQDKESSAQDKESSAQDKESGAQDKESSAQDKESGAQAVNSSHYPGVLNELDSDEIFENNEVEEVVGRWQSSEARSSESLAGDDDGGGDGEAGHQPLPKRSAMRTNSSEGKRKSVSFVQANGEADKEVDEETWIKYDPIDSMNEMETESGSLRKRQIEERSRKLSNKVDNMKKKMKDHEKRNDSLFGKAMIAGLVMCVVVAGVAFFYYRYQS